MKIQIVAYDQARQRIEEREFEANDRFYAMIEDIRARLHSPILKRSNWHSIEITITKE
jgi:hypothetical protein